MKNILLFSILVVAIFLRLYKLDTVPGGIYNDETITGYEAYSIATNFKDQYGTFLPITFKAFGEYRPGLYIYSVAPFVKLFGLNEFSTRLPSVILSIGIVLSVYWITKQLTKSSKVALLAALLTSVSPWNMLYGRMSHETNLATFLALAGLGAYLSSVSKPRLILLSVLLFTLSTYAYFNMRVFVPMALICLFIWGRKKGEQWKKLALISAIAGFLLVIPNILVSLQKEQGLSRIEAISLWGDAGILANIVQGRQEAGLVGAPFSSLFHNKFLETGLTFTRSFASHFDARFLVTQGDPINLYNVPGNGLILYIEGAFLLVGLFALTKNTKLLWLFGFWILLGFLPDALTRLAPQSVRIHMVFPVLSIIAAIGIWYVTSKITKTKRIVFTIFLVSIFSFNTAYFLNSYFTHFSIRRAREWHYGLKEVVETAQKYENRYDQIWVSKNAHEWINFLYFLKYPPKKAQHELVLSDLNEYGMGRVNEFHTYHFDTLPACFDYTKNMLYVGEPWEFPKTVEPEHTVYYPNGDSAYILVSTAALKKTCPTCDINMYKDMIECEKSKLIGI